jgi:ABC-2 type transport system permease protein
MKKYLQIEYMKIKGNSSFKVFTLMFLILMPIIVIILPSFFKDGLFGLGSEDSYPFMPRTASSTWYYTTYIASWFSFYLLSFIIIFHITNEYAAKTVRQNIIDGYSKLDYLKSKIGMVIFMATTATLYVFIIGLIAALYFKNNQPDQSTQLPDMMSMLGGDMSNNSIVTEFGSMFDGLLFVLGYYIQVLAYFIVAVLVSMLVRKGALAVLMFFGLFFINMILSSVIGMQGFEAILDYLPFNSFSGLLPNFDLQFLIFGLGEMETLSTENAIISIAYIVLFIFLTKVIFYNRDVV